MKMKIATCVGIGILALLWLWLVTYILLFTHFTLLSLIWIAISGIIIFVPLYKKYFKKSEK